MKGLVISIISLFVFVSCTTPNPYSQWYTQYYDGILIPTENVEVIRVSSDDYIKYRNELYTQGYGLIGETSFNWDYKDEKFAIDHAKSIGADTVIISSEYTDTSTYTSGVVSLGLGAAPITSSERRFDQNALYFLKDIERGRYGFYYEPLTSEEKQKNEINYGLKLFVIVNNSPMQKAGAVPGDILIEIDGRKVISDSDIYDDGISTTLKVLRNGEEKQIEVIFDK
jgi:hypothetical protein